jgi:hypothetical protein
MKRERFAPSRAGNNVTSNMAKALDSDLPQIGISRDFGVLSTCCASRKFGFG